jgi:phosphatidate phosphatase LPIN
VRVNDREIPFTMKVGETGEAFFIFETDEDVPADMQTSPLAEPEPDAAGSVVPPLDIGESQTLDGPDEHPPASEDSVEEKDVSDPSAGGSSLLQSTAARVAGISSAIASGAGPAKLVPIIKMRRLRSRLSRDKTAEGSDAVLEEDEVESAEPIEDDRFVAAPDTDELSHRPSEGHEVRQAVRREQQGLSESGLSTYDEAVEPFTPSNASTTPEHPRTPGLESKDHLMLDMSGYKFKSEDQSKAKAIQTSLLSKEIFEHSDQKLRRCLLQLASGMSRPNTYRRRPGSVHASLTKKLGCSQEPRGCFYA